MNSFAESLSDLRDRITGEYSLSADERELIHNAYWNGNPVEISTVLEIMCLEPDASDLPMLLDASSPGSLWIHRCDAAQALNGLEEGVRILRLMLERETHPVVRFYVMRELIDLEDETATSLLDGPIPAIGSPSRRSLWIYGNFERDSLTKERALILIKRLLEDPKRRHEWLRNHILAGD